MTSESSERHHRAAEGRGPVPIAIVTVSDSRTEETDTNGRWLREAAAAAGHAEGGYRLIRDEPDEVAAALEEMAAGPGRIVLFNGGTGIAPRDTTFDVLSRMIAAAMLSRATAGVYRGRVVFSMPGSPAAVRLAWEKLIAPEVGHLAWLVEG
jgi:molybdenum cofactor biosynthesis protein B